ncbi:hypothetical protein TH63_12910 [Rufibacter radiotolerans]|uniref:Uncharacterized protein n=1 Tax=Rufibacter radiotolerans TaxID=1379910 RepID=A0A0H4W7A6_9BACT|nr:hypothetical protein TH63_12910 [Rufibacter radiotolerans]
MEKPLPQTLAGAARATRSSAPAQSSKKQALFPSARQAKEGIATDQQQPISCPVPGGGPPPRSPKHGQGQAAAIQLAKA